jgi:hypothetical protein
MKTRTIQIKNAAAALVIATLFGAPATSNAAVITLSGGDPGEGYAPLSNSVYAYNTGQDIADARTVQNVTFLPFNISQGPVAGTVTRSGSWGGYDGFTPPSLGASANDVALANILNKVWFVPGEGFTGTLTLGGLEAAKQYQVDLFVWSPDANRNTVFTFNGGQTNAFVSMAGVPYNVRETVYANGSGEIVVQEFADPSLGATGSTGSENAPVLNGFSVTVPEPSAVMLLGLGGLLLWRRRTQLK